MYALSKSLNVKGFHSQGLRNNYRSYQQFNLNILLSKTIVQKQQFCSKKNENDETLRVIKSLNKQRRDVTEYGTVYSIEEANALAKERLDHIELKKTFFPTRTSDYYTPYESVKELNELQSKENIACKPHQLDVTDENALQKAAPKSSTSLPNTSEEETIDLTKISEEDENSTNPTLKSQKLILKHYLKTRILELKTAKIERVINFGTDIAPSEIKLVKIKSIDQDIKLCENAIALLTSELKKSDNVVIFEDLRKREYLEKFLYLRRLMKENDVPLPDFVMPKLNTAPLEEFVNRLENHKDFLLENVYTAKKSFSYLPEILKPFGPLAVTRLLLKLESKIATEIYVTLSKENFFDYQNQDKLFFDDAAIYSELQKDEAAYIESVNNSIPVEDVDKQFPRFQPLHESPIEAARRKTYHFNAPYTPSNPSAIPYLFTNEALQTFSRIRGFLQKLYTSYDEPFFTEEKGDVEYIMDSFRANEITHSEEEFDNPVAWRRIGSLRGSDAIFLRQPSENTIKQKIAVMNHKLEDLIRGAKLPSNLDIAIHEFEFVKNSPSLEYHNKQFFLEKLKNLEILVEVDYSGNEHLLAKVDFLKDLVKFDFNYFMKINVVDFFHLRNISHIPKLQEELKTMQALKLDTSELIERIEELQKYDHQRPKYILSPFFRKLRLLRLANEISEEKADWKTELQHFETLLSENPGIEEYELKKTHISLYDAFESPEYSNQVREDYFLVLKELEQLEKNPINTNFALYHEILDLLILKSGAVKTCHEYNFFQSNMEYNNLLAFVYTDDPELKNVYDLKNYDVKFHRLCAALHDSEFHKMEYEDYIENEGYSERFPEIPDRHYATTYLQSYVNSVCDIKSQFKTLISQIESSIINTESSEKHVLLKEVEKLKSELLNIVKEEQLKAEVEYIKTIEENVPEDGVPFSFADLKKHISKTVEKSNKLVAEFRSKLSLLSYLAQEDEKTKKMITKFTESVNNHTDGKIVDPDILQTYNQLYLTSYKYITQTKYPIYSEPEYKSDIGGYAEDALNRYPPHIQPPPPEEIKPIKDNKYYKNDEYMKADPRGTPQTHDYGFGVAKEVYQPTAPHGVDFDVVGAKDTTSTTDLSTDVKNIEDFHTDFFNIKKESEGWKHEKFFNNPIKDEVLYADVTTIIPEREGDEVLQYTSLDRGHEQILDPSSLLLEDIKDDKDDKEKEKLRAKPGIKPLPFDAEDRKHFGYGKRKAANSLVVVKPKIGEGRIIVNGRPFVEYFPSLLYRCAIVAPLVATERLNYFDITVTVKGGGFKGQAEATRIALARALENFDREFHPILRFTKLSKGDNRKVERKKPGKKKARKSFAWVKR